jgi:hypothetical protein
MSRFLMMLNLAVFLRSHTHAAFTPVKNTIDEEASIKIVLLPYVVSVHGLSNTAQPTGQAACYNATIFVHLVLVLALNDCQSEMMTVGD